MKELWEPLPPALRDSFPNFACYLLRELGLADTPTRQQIAVCNWMQKRPGQVTDCGFPGAEIDSCVVLCVVATKGRPVRKDPGGFSYGSEEH